MSFFGYALLIGACVGVFIGAWRHVPWFGPGCIVILVSFFGYGALVEIIVRTSNPAMWSAFAPAIVFFGLGGLSFVWCKFFPRGKKYGTALFFGACGICCLVYLSGIPLSRP